MDRAQHPNILSPLGSQSLKHRVSIYGDDVILFTEPSISNFLVINEILLCLEVQKIYNQLEQEQDLSNPLL
jgi:hypothetical protein